MPEGASPYSKKVMDHFVNPRNMGEIADATVVADVGNPACGDMMRLYRKIQNLWLWRRHCHLLDADRNAQRQVAGGSQVDIESGGRRGA
jgi:hypothetical protein